MFLFLFLIVITLLLIEFIFKNKQSKVELSKNTNYIVLGHSHPEFAFNDSLINGFKNLGASGENYFYLYQKAKWIIHNTTLKTVFIEFTNNCINVEMNNWMYGENFILKKFPKYFPIMSYNDKFQLLKKHPFNFLRSYPLGLSNQIQNVFKSQITISELGGFNKLNRVISDSLLNLKTITNRNQAQETSEINLHYLDKIIELCKQNHKEVIFVRSPQHPKYQGYANESLFQNIFRKKYRNLTFYDFANFPLTDSCFADLEHLNYKGANQFSKWVNHLIKDSILFKPNSNDLINNELKELTL